MAFPFVALALFLVSTALSLVLRPKFKRPKAPNLEIPKADEGVPIPIPFGTAALAPNIVWCGDLDKAQASNGATYYYATMIGTLALGELDYVVDIQFGGKSLQLAPVTSDQGGPDGATSVVSPAPTDGQWALTGDGPLTLTVNARQLFGGRDQEGGVQGEIRIYRGTTHQPVDALSDHAMVQRASSIGATIGGTARPGVAYICFGTPDTPFYWGTNPVPKDVVVIVRRFPHGLVDQALDANYVTPRVGRQDVNFGEVVYDLLTNDWTGAGEDPANVDSVALTSASLGLANEQLGGGGAFATQEAVRDLLEDVQKHADGALYEHRETGLWTFALARGGYDPNALFNVNPGNTDRLTITRSSWLDTTNQITMTYRRFDTGSTSPTVVTGEVLTLYVQPLGIEGDFIRYYQVDGRNISAYTLYAINETGTTTLVEGTDYTVNVGSGVFYLLPGGTVAVGDQLVADYTAAGQSFLGYREGTLPWQDLANFRATGQVRALAVDYPFFTADLTAGKGLARLGARLARPLAKAKWTVNRTGHATVPVGVVTVTHPGFELLAVPFRITTVDYGTLEEGPIEVEAIEDVWGVATAAVIPAPGSGGQGDVFTAPPIAGIDCLVPSAIDVEVFAGDPNFAIEVQRADDAIGTNATTITAPGGEFATAGVLVVHDTQTVGVTKWYRARHIRLGWVDGPWTEWHPCTAESGDTPPPQVILPTITDTPTQDDIQGHLLVEITDPQGRLISVEFRHQAGTDPETAYALDTAPYTDDVDLVGTLVSTITRRVTYYDATGTPFADIATFPFSLDDTGGPGAGFQATSTESPLNATVGGSYEILAAPLVLTALPADTEQWIDATGCTRVRLETRVTEAGPAGLVLVPQFTVVLNPTETQWACLDGTAEPAIALDQVGRIKTPYFPLAPNAQTDIQVRWCTRGGDGTTNATLGKTALRFAGRSEDVTPCSEALLDGFDYASLAEFEAQYTEDDTLGAGSTTTLDPGAISPGVTAVKIAINTTDAGLDTWERVLPGGLPNAPVVLTMRAKATDLSGITAGLELDGGQRALVSAISPAYQTLAVSGTRDEAGAALARFGVFQVSASNAGTVEDFTEFLDTAAINAAWTLSDNLGGGATWTLTTAGERSYDLHVPNTNVYPGYKTHRRKTFSFTPNALVTVTVDLWSSRSTNNFFAGFGVNDNIQTYQLAAGRQTVSHAFYADGSANLNLTLGAGYANPGIDLKYYSITFSTGAAATPVVASVWFDSLTESCLTSVPNPGDPPPVGEPPPGGGPAPVPTECDGTGRNVITLSGHQSSLYDNRTVPQGTYIDASTADWIGTDASETGTERMVQVRGGSGITWCGGRAKSVRPVSYSLYHGIVAYEFYAQGATIRSASAINSGDLYDFNWGSENFVLDGCYGKTARDDGVQNDRLANGLITDCLLEDLYTAISARPALDTYDLVDGRGKLFTIRDTLLYVRRQPVFDSRSPFGHVFKWYARDDGRGIHLALYNCTIRVDETEAGSASDLHARGYLSASSGNTLVWTGAGTYPASIPSGFTVTTDVSVWTSRRAAWIAAHPDVDTTY